MMEYRSLSFFFVCRHGPVCGRIARLTITAWFEAMLLSPTLFAQAVDAMFVLETTPGTEQAIGLLRPRDLHETDRAGVIEFFKSAQVRQSLTDSRDALAKALRQAGTRVARALSLAHF